MPRLGTTRLQLKVRQQRAEARAKALASRRERKDDTRRKILIGAVVLAKIEQGKFEQRTLKRWLDRALTRMTGSEQTIGQVTALLANRRGERVSPEAILESPRRRCGILRVAVGGLES